MSLAAPMCKTLSVNNTNPVNGVGCLCTLYSMGNQHQCYVIICPGIRHQRARTISPYHAVMMETQHIWRVSQLVKVK